MRRVCPGGGLAVGVLLPGHGLFTLRGGQRRIDGAAAQIKRGVVPRMIGQGDFIFSLGKVSYPQ